MQDVSGQLSIPLFESVSATEHDRSRKGTKRANREPEGADRREPIPVAEIVTDEPLAADRRRLLTTAETAELLHVHVRTVQRLVERGELCAVHLGAAVRFDPVDVAALTERLKRYASSAPTATSDVRRGRGTPISFADRLRSATGEHRAAQA